MKLCILDKDKTLVEPKSGETFVQHPEDQVLLPGVKERIEEMAADGWTFVICSNQGGVEKGYKTIENAIAEMQYCLELLPFVQMAWICSDFEGKELYRVDRSCFVYEEATGGFLLVKYSRWINYRKPNPGMLQRARHWFTEEVSMKPECEWIEAIYVGDRPEDSQAAEAAGIPFMDAALWRSGAPL